MKRTHVILLVAVLVIAGIVAFVVTRTKDDSLRVPLGVEQAAIVNYSGPLLAVAPYKWGVAVNVRIAEVTEKADRRVYDLRYIVNRAGTFDLKDYLVADDGSALMGLPSFKFEGDPKLSKNLDTRIQETEEIRVDVGGRYYEWMALLTLLWIGWLMLLIFWRRPKPPADADSGPPPPTLTELMRGFLAQLEAGTLTADAKAKMEMVMLQCWRDELALNDVSIDEAHQRIASNERTGGALRKLEHWLHHPSSSVPSAEIAAVIKPYTTPAAP
jgi:hypothetical protein